MYVLILTVVVVLLLSSLISLSESAILSINKTKFNIHKKDNATKKSVIFLNDILNKKSEYISSLVILGTIFNVGGSVIIGNMTANTLTSKIDNFNLGFFTVSFSALFAICFTLLVLYFSKMIPKLIGAQAPLKTSLLVSPIVYFLNVFVKPLSLMSQKICAPFVKTKDESKLSMLEIKYILRQGFKNDLIKEREFEIINNSLLLNQKTVKDIMKPKKDIEMFSATSSISDCINDIKSFKHRRIIITLGQETPIPSGIVVVSDLMRSYINGEDKKIGDFAHKLLVINENQTLSHVLADFNNSLDHLALIENNDGEYVGIVAIEDIFENMTIGFDN